MKRLSITQLVPGMTVAEDVYDLDHELLIQKGTILTDKLITKLDLYGILTILSRISYNPCGLLRILLTLSSLTPSALRVLRNFNCSRQILKMMLNCSGKYESRDSKNTSLDVNTLLKNTMAIVANHSGSISILDMLQNMREYDDSTYTHSLNVALICNILAGWLKLSDEEIELATACGLFHDIGKLLIPYSIIQNRESCPRKNLQRSKSIPPWVTSFSCPRMWMIM